MSSPDPTASSDVPTKSLPAPPAQALPWATMLFIAALALLLASFTERRPDLWAHLAAGRDPSLSLDVHRHWLFNVVVFRVHSLFGDAGLVGVKALLVAAAALCVLVTCRAHAAGRPAAFAAVAALIACGLRLPLLPVTASLFLLALALWLVRPREKEPSPWPLLPLFLVWANVDGWFLVGLVAVGMVWVGRSLDGSSRSIAWWPLLVAACLLNPFLHGAFVPPKDLELASPFSEVFATRYGANPGGAAFVLLLLWGALALLSGARRARWERFLPFFAFAVLACLSMRAIPFFAVAAAPVLAWGFSRLGIKDRASLAWSLPILVPAALLLVLAWPGWLQAPPAEPRRWAVELPRGPILAAREARRWKGVGLHLSPETFAAFAWESPDVPGVLRRPEEKPPMENVGYIVVTTRNREGMDSLMSDPDQASLLFLKGGVAVFSWGKENRARALDLDALAFAPAEEDRAPDEAPDEAGRSLRDGFFTPLPRTDDREEAVLLGMLADAARAPAPMNLLLRWESSQAVSLIGTLSGPSAGWLPLSHWNAAMFRWPRQGEGEPPPLLRIVRALQERIEQGNDDVPPSLVYLAIRAARRAIAADPRDALAHAVLGESYLRLFAATRERAWARRSAELAQLRMAQAIFALNRAVQLDPSLHKAHLSLVGIYSQAGYMDLAHRHLGESIRWRKKAGPPLGMEVLRFDSEMAGFVRWHEQMGRAVASAREAHDKEAAGRMVRARAESARAKGLAGLARDILLASDISAFSDEGMLLELELLLGTGRPGDVLRFIAPQHKNALKAGYHWLRAQAMAARGEYAEAGEECRAIAATLREDANLGDTDFKQAVAARVGKAFLDGRWLHPTVPHLVAQARDQFDLLSSLGRLTSVMRRQSDSWVFRGLLSLERGDTAAARVAFKNALALTTDGGIDFALRPAAEAWLKTLDRR